MESSRTLYVEDNDDDFEFLSIVFRKLRYLGSLARANDVTSAKAHLQEAAETGKLPELIVIDLRLGAERGKDLIEFIRGKQEFQEIPLVALSGTYVFQDMDEAYQSGANLFLIKPADMQGWIKLATRLQEYFVQI